MNASFWRFASGTIAAIVAVQSSLQEGSDRVPRVVARPEVEAARQARQRVLADVSHQLRTPLTVVLGYTELLADGIAGPLTPLQGEYLARVQASGSELLRLIDSLFRSAEGSPP
jgi:signal transduction histidine kinase